MTWLKYQTTKNAIALATSTHVIIDMLADITDSIALFRWLQQSGFEEATWWRKLWLHQCQQCGCMHLNKYFFSLSTSFYVMSAVQGYNRKGMYIAAQGKVSGLVMLHPCHLLQTLGPTENSVEDFWRMIWERCVPTLVMLTRVYEGRVSGHSSTPSNIEQKGGLESTM